MEEKKEVVIEPLKEVKKPRLLKPHEIDCRVGTIKANGFSLLLYKDARVDMAILDETYGNNNWQRTHEVINGNLFCNIEIWADDKKCWVKKQDVGTESFTEKEKGEASDSFKRAGFNIGIGRELYTAPFIWITPKDKTEIKEKDGRYSTFTKIIVTKIDYDKEKAISKLILEDDKGKVRFTYGLTKEDEKELMNKMPITESQLQMIENMVKDTNTKIVDILKTYKVNELDKLNYLQGEQVKEILEKKMKK